MRFPKASSGGLAPAECKDHSVFIFISEEIKKKNLGINAKQVFLLLFSVLADEAEVVECEKLDGNTEVVTPTKLCLRGLPFCFDFKEQKIKTGTSAWCPGPTVPPTVWN